LISTIPTTSDENNESIQNFQLKHQTQLNEIIIATQTQPGYVVVAVKRDSNNEGFVPGTKTAFRN